jgi:hypothetical protein
MMDNQQYGKYKDIFCDSRMCCEYCNPKECYFMKNHDTTIRSDEREKVLETIKELCEEQIHINTGLGQWAKIPHTNKQIILTLKSMLDRIETLRGVENTK